MINQNIQVKEPDEILEEPQTADEVDFYQKGYEQLDVSQSNIEQIGAFIHILTTMNNLLYNYKKLPEKGVTNDHHRHLQGAVFAFGSEGINSEWKEHSASSLREMISFILNGKDFTAIVKIYCDENNKIDSFSECEKLCNKIRPYYDYFTAITHHQARSIMYRLRPLIDNELEFNECLKDENYKRVFKQFFLDLIKIIQTIEYETT